MYYQYCELLTLDQILQTACAFGLSSLVLDPMPETFEHAKQQHSEVCAAQLGCHSCNPSPLFAEVIFEGILTQAFTEQKQVFFSVLS